MENIERQYHKVNECVDMIVTIKEKDGVYDIKGETVRSRTTQPVGRARQYTRTVSSKEDIPFEVDEMLALAREHCMDVKPVKEAVVSADGEPPLGDKLQACFAEMQRDGVPIIGRNEVWADSTRNRAMIYFDINVLPALVEALNSGDYTNSKNLDALRTAIAEKSSKRILASDKEIGPEELAEKTKKLFVTHMEEASRIYNTLRMCYPGEFPLLPLKVVKSNVKRLVHEQPRVIPVPIMAGLVCFFEQNAVSHPKEVFVLILVFVGGARIGEACGTLPCDVCFNSDGSATARIRHQERDGVRSPKLKNKYSSRDIPIPSWGTRILRMCIDAMGEDAELYNKESKIPLILKARASAFLDLAFENVGFDVVALERAVEETRGYSVASVEERATSHLMSRNAAGLLANICGLSDDKVDAILGHERSTSAVFRFDLKDPQVCSEIALAMERVVYSTDCTRNPAYAPVCIDPNETLKMPQFEKVRIRNDSDTPIKLSLDLKANTLGTGIRLTAANIVNAELRSETDDHNVCLHNDKFSELVIYDKEGDKDG